MPHLSFVYCVFIYSKSGVISYADLDNFSVHASCYCKLAIRACSSKMITRSEQIHSESMRIIPRTHTWMLGFVYDDRIFSLFIQVLTVSSMHPAFAMPLSIPSTSSILSHPRGSTRCLSRCRDIPDPGIVQSVKLVRSQERLFVCCIL